MTLEEYDVLRDIKTLAREVLLVGVVGSTADALRSQLARHDALLAAAAKYRECGADCRVGAVRDGSRHGYIHGARR